MANVNQTIVPESEGNSNGGTLKHKLDDNADAINVKKKCPLVRIRLTNSLLNDQSKSKFLANWTEPGSLHIDDIHLVDSPFQLCKITDLLDRESAEFAIPAMVREMSEEMAWTRRKTDFLQLNQTCDLISAESHALTAFYQFLKTDLLQWMRQWTGMDLTHVSANCSMYNYGDHLLVHDDCIADRKIAFVYYLSPWKGRESWTAEMGGALELFSECDGNVTFPPVKRVTPQNNQLIFFRVSNKSFHQVGEVLTMDYPRLTINGWFHGPGDEFIAQVRPNPLATQLSAAEPRQLDMSEWINENYLTAEIKAEIQGEIEGQSQISLHRFLIDHLIEVQLNELRSNPNLLWHRPYSAMERNYEVLKWTDGDKVLVKGPLLDLWNLFQSSSMFQLLHEYTDLDLSGANARKPSCHIELQRWTNECYTLLTNESKETYLGNVLDVILYLNSSDAGVGSYVYVNQNEEDVDVQSDPEDTDSETGDEKEEVVEEDSDVLLTVVPQSNSLNIIYCNEGVSRFGQFVSKSIAMKDDYVYILCCTYKE